MVATMRGSAGKGGFHSGGGGPAKYHSGVMAEPGSTRLPVQRLGTLLLRVVRQAGDLQLQNTAASLAFLSLLAIVPIFSIVVSVLSTLPVFEGLRETLQDFLARNLFLPAISDTILEYVNRFSAQARQLSLAGALMFFATAISCMLTIDRTLNRIWGTARPRPLAQRLTIYWALLTVAPLLLGASITVNGMLVSQWLRGGEFETARRFWFASLTWVGTGAGLLLLYRLVPNTTVRWRDAAVGAAVATVLIQVLREALGNYLGNFATYTIIYGAFSVLPLFLLWLFLLWSIVLLGALLSSSLRYWGHDTAPRPVPTPAERFGDALAIVRVLARQAPLGHGQGMPAAAWREAFDEQGLRAERAARLVAEQGYIHRMIRVDQDVDPDEDPVWSEHWSLARPACEMTLTGLFAAVWGDALPDVSAPGLAVPLDRWADGSAAAPVVAAARVPA